MAATSQPLATQIALDVMRAGGSAVDAAIAANAALGLMEPTGNGIGGDLFAIVWDPEDAAAARLQRPAAARRGAHAATSSGARLHEHPAARPLPVTVPGTVDGWFALHERFGKLPMARCWRRPSATRARAIPGHELIAYYWERSVPRWRIPRASPSSSPSTAARRARARCGATRPRRHPGAIAAGARRLLQGRHRAHDRRLHAGQRRLPRYEDWPRTAPSGSSRCRPNYRGYDVWELPPNGQGIAALQILNILEGYDLASRVRQPEHVHLFVEAKKLAFEDRARFYADPASPGPGGAADLQGVRRERRADRSGARGARVRRRSALDEGDTIYLTTADADGMMVSLIQSNYRGMGSGMTPPGLGFILQDRGEQFD
jgi:gamma-glutamyltranspeptidase / glutathione hydrolase